MVLAAEPLWHVGDFPITNSLATAGVVTVILSCAALIANRRTSVVPRGIHNVIEAIFAGLLREFQKVTGDSARARAFFPLVATLFLFILTNNWLGLLPGAGTIGLTVQEHGVTEFLPLLRPATSDVNLTLALAVFSIIVVQIAGIRAQGAMIYVSKFVNIRGVVRAMRHGPMAVLTAVIEFFVGLLEIVGEFARIASLSLRLFGNVFAGEVLMGVMLGLVGLVVPIPFLFLEILVGVIQATVFSMLVLVFLTVATTPHGHAAQEHAH